LSLLICFALGVIHIGQSYSVLHDRSPFSLSGVVSKSSTSESAVRSRVWFLSRCQPERSNPCRSCSP